MDQKLLTKLWDEVSRRGGTEARACASFVHAARDRIKTDGDTEYGEAYRFADIPKEWREELLDVVSWILLDALRLMELYEKRVQALDYEYWHELLKTQDSEHLHKLRHVVDNILESRKTDPVEAKEEEDGKGI